MTPQSLTMSLPTTDEIREATELVYSVMPPTPQIVWPLLCERLGTEVWVKHENHTPIGTFKARTAVVYAAELFRGTTGITGLVTATRGNHGQSVALAARRFKVPAHVVVPHGNSREKNAAMRAQGAHLVEFGSDYQEAKEHSQKLAQEHGWHFVPGYHRDIVKGVATYWLEFLLRRRQSGRGLRADWPGLGNLCLFRGSQWNEPEDEDRRRGSPGRARIRALI